MCISVDLQEKLSRMINAPNFMCCVGTVQQLLLVVTRGSYVHNCVLTAHLRPVREERWKETS